MKKIKTGITLLTILALISCKSGQQETSQTVEQQTTRQKPQGNRDQSRQKPNPENLISEMDSNNDGKLSKNEVKGPLANDFSKIDTDDDGYITLEELEKAPKPERGGGQGGRPQGGRN